MPSLSLLVSAPEGKKLTPRYVYEHGTNDEGSLKGYIKAIVTPAELVDLLKHRTCSAVCVSTDNFGLVDLGVIHAIRRIEDKLRPKDYCGGKNSIEYWEAKISEQAGIDLQCYVSITVLKVENAKHENYHVWIQSWGTQTFGDTDSYYPYQG